jgi:uncharacterized membrane protein
MAISEKLVALFLIALVVLLFLGLLLFRSTRASPEQRFGFIAAVFIQLIGTIAFGAVVSYSLFKIQHAQELSEKQRGDVDVAATNKKRVISYIKAELSYDLDAIKVKRGASTVLDFAVQKTPLKSDFWKIAGLSGDLKWIDDVELLDLIAQAYFNIDNVHSWEIRFLDATFGMGLVMTVNVGGQTMPMRDFVTNFLKDTYPPAVGAIEAALAKL